MLYVDILTFNVFQCPSINTLKTVPLKILLQFYYMIGKYTNNLTENDRISVAKYITRIFYVCMYVCRLPI